MEEQKEAPSPTPALAEPIDQDGVVPFMRDHDIGAVERAIEIEGRTLVGMQFDARHQAGAFLQDRCSALLLQRVRAAPAVRRLMNSDVVASRVQRAGEAPQEMRVAVIPA